MVLFSRRGENAGPAVGIPRSVWILGLVSLCMDLSSEMIHALLPLYMVKVLATPVMAVGLIEGFAEATAMMARFFSGVISDHLRRPKLLALVGYGLSAISKPLFPMASGLGLLLSARLIDRFGKGIRGAPRDALLAAIAPESIRGACFGLRQSLDTAGAFLAPLAAIGIMLLTSDNYDIVFWIAVIPAFLAVLLLAVGIREHDEPGLHAAPSPPTRAHSSLLKLSLRPLADLPSGLRVIFLLALLFSLARFSDAFLILRSQEAGLPVAWVPLVLVVMNLVYAGSAYPAGRLSDMFGRPAPLIAGTAVLILGDFLLSAPGLLLPGLGVIAWGLHLGLTQGVLSAMIADRAPDALKGTAFGLLNLTSGIGLLAASLIAGALWDRIGSPAMFLTATLPAAAALILLIIPNSEDESDRLAKDAG